MDLGLIFADQIFRGFRISLDASYDAIESLVAFMAFKFNGTSLLKKLAE
jgi:hypothetical protein